ncbi:MAG: histidine phosphatase family protein [Verrucomicrobiota bacterium]
MKELLLIRHAKSSWNSPGLSDHDRPLNGRGERDAPRIAAALEQRGVKPDLVVTSTAVRARTTARMVAEGLSFPIAEIIEVGELYHAFSGEILRVVQTLNEDANCALLFGHNPGMHEATDCLSREGGVDSFPTLATARFELDVDYWGNVEWGSGLLLECLYPRMLDEA